MYNIFFYCIRKDKNSNYICKEIEEKDISLLSKSSNSHIISLCSHIPLYFRKFFINKKLYDSIIIDLVV